MTDAERCVSCGAVIPEGRQVCPICYAKYHNDYSEELAYLWKVLKKTESSLRTADKRNAPNEERANLRKRRDMLYTIINIVEDAGAVSRKEPPKEPKNPPIHLDIGEYEKIMKEVARVAL